MTGIQGKYIEPRGMIRNEGAMLSERNTKTRHWNGQQAKGNPANQNRYIRCNWSPTPKQGLFKTLSTNFNIKPINIKNMIALPRLNTNNHPKIDIFLSIGSPSLLIQVVVK